MARPALALALLVALAGCDSTAFPDDDTELQTDDDVYLALATADAVQFEAGLTYTNSSGGTVYFTGCVLPEPPVLEKRVGGEWVYALSAVVPLCLREPLAVEPGESVDYVFQPYACLRERCAPEWGLGPAPETVPGTYRLRTSVATEVEGGLPARSREVVSNSFRVVLAD